MKRNLVRGGKLLVGTAAVWAVGVSLYIFFTPMNVSGVTGAMTRNSDEILKFFTRQQSWYEAQGPGGVIALAVFSGVYLLALGVTWKRNYQALAIICAIAVALTVIAGFSIGVAYVPAALGLLIATPMLLSSKWLK